MGHNIIGVDVSLDKVDMINKGVSPIVEKEVDKLILNGVKSRQIKAVHDAETAVLNTELSFLCVGTPNTDIGHLDMSAIYSVAIEIGYALKKKESHHIIVIRSTVIPGTNSKVGEIIEKESGKKNGIDFSIISNPEFLREGCAVNDFFKPPFTVIAGNSEKAIEKIKELYRPLESDLIQTDIKIAEMIKLINNSFHGLKVAFANEIGRLCKRIDIDSRELMELFCKDRLLNISPYYFKPGFAYGGSCLPKDLKALQLLMHDNYVKAPIVSSIEESNEEHITYAENLILSAKKKRLLFISICFKSGTDDLRFSPALKIVERLIGKGFKIKVYDKNLNLSRLMGKNKEFLYDTLPHIEALMVDSLEEAIAYGEAIIISNNEQYIKEGLEDIIKGDKKIIDLSGVWGSKSTKDIQGICW
jgi:GDP-mannose 6-dehydrogenase